MLKSSRIPSNDARPAKQLSGGCAVLFGLPFILAGLAVGWFAYYPGISGWWSARGWEEVPCQIENVNLQSKHSKKGSDTYQTTASYRYRYHGREFRGDKVGLFGGADNIGDFQQQAYEQMRTFEQQSRPFRCYVNPAHPEQSVLFRDLRWGLLLLTSIFPTLFPLIGGLVAVGGFMQARESAQVRCLAQQHPAEPWHWRKEWSGEMIRESKRGLVVILVVAGWIALVQAPLALAVTLSGELMKSFRSVFALLPSSLALIPLYFAWGRIQTRRALGNLSLRLKQMPTSPGSTLEGELCFDRALSPREVIQAQVLCQRTIITRSSKSTTTTKETLWEHTEMLSASEARRDLKGVMLPLHINIPRDLPCPRVGEASTQTQHEWSLRVTPSGGGKAAVLPLPIFRTTETPDITENDTAQKAELAAPTAEQLISRLRLRGVTAQFDAEGIPELFDCAPGRLRFLALFLLFFGIIWSTAFIALVSQGVPWIFRAIWGLSSPLIVGLGLWMLMHRRRVEFTRDELRVEHHIGRFYSWSEKYAPRHIIGFKYDSNMQSGSQIYYRVRAETTFGKMVTLVDGITGSITAETLVARLDDWRKRK